MLKHLIANCSAFKGAGERWVTQAIFCILPRISRPLPVLLLQHMLGLATGCTTMWNLLSASEGPVQRWVIFTIFSFLRKIFPYFPVLLLQQMLLAVVDMLLSFANNYSKAVLTRAVTPSCFCNICSLMWSAFAYLLRYQV